MRLTSQRFRCPALGPGGKPIVLEIKLLLDKGFLRNFLLRIKDFLESIAPASPDTSQGLKQPKSPFCSQLSTEITPLGLWLLDLPHAGAMMVSLCVTHLESKGDSMGRYVHVTLHMWRSKGN